MQSLLDPVILYKLQWLEHAPDTSMSIRRVRYYNCEEYMAFGQRFTPDGIFVCESVSFAVNVDQHLLEEKIQLISDLRHTAKAPYFNSEEKTRWELRADILEFAIYFLEEL